MFTVEINLINFTTSIKIYLPPTLLPKPNMYAFLIALHICIQCANNRVTRIYTVLWKCTTYSLLYNLSPYKIQTEFYSTNYRYLRMNINTFEIPGSIQFEISTHNKGELSLLSLIWKGHTFIHYSRLFYSYNIYWSQRCPYPINSIYIYIAIIH